jgi:uncharacterized protein (UPF0303 family)
MSLDSDIARIALQEQRLRFDHFNEDDAWKLGEIIRDEATRRGTPVVIDIRLHGRPLFYYAMAGTTADHPEWVRRKSAVTLRFFKSSYGFGRDLLKKGQSIGVERGTDPLHFAPHGGSFPIHIRGTGVAGAVTVSGPPQRDDHAIVTAGLIRFLNENAEELMLGPEEA